MANTLEPVVSVGMPVYNEGQFIEKTLESLLEQTYQNIRIVVCDDYSTDNTAEVCKKYAAKDRRLRYVRNEKNIGEVDNFNKAFSFAEGKYFMWAAGHDLWDKTFVEKAVAIMERNSSVVACSSFRKHIDSDGKVINIDNTVLDTRGNGKLLRFVKSIWTLYDMIFSLTRTDSLKKQCFTSQFKG